MLLDVSYALGKRHDGALAFPLTLSVPFSRSK